MGCAALLTALAVSLFLNIGTRELTQEEPRRALVALEMELSGNYIVPTLNGEIYYIKPPLYNWVLAALFKHTSVAREVGRALAKHPVLAHGRSTAVFACRTLHQPTRRSTVQLVDGDQRPHLFQFLDAGRNRPLLYAGVVSCKRSAIFYLLREESASGPMFLVSYTLTAAGLLTKGLPSVAMQGLTLLAWFSLNKRFWMLFSLQHIVGLVLCVVMVAAYYYVVQLLWRPTALHRIAAERGLLQDRATNEYDQRPDRPFL